MANDVEGFIDSIVKARLSEATTWIAQDAVLRQAIEKWGEESQMGMAIEECAEFIVACRKLSRVGGREIKPESMAAFIDEVADVAIMMRQMTIIAGEYTVNERIAFKIDRLKTRLEQ
jgi:hypothetical protein